MRLLKTKYVLGFNLDNIRRGSVNKIDRSPLLSDMVKRLFLQKYSSLSFGVDITNQRIKTNISEKIKRDLKVKRKVLLDNSYTKKRSCDLIDLKSKVKADTQKELFNAIFGSVVHMNEDSITEIDILYSKITNMNDYLNTISVLNEINRTFDI